MLFAAAAVAAASAGPAHAQLASNFYEGKTLRVIVGYPPGATFDTYSRALIRHMPKHLPGRPSMIVQNMPGAGSLTATSYIANVAPKDGTVIGMPNPVNTVEPLLNPKNARFDPREFSWIGSMNSERSSCAFWGGRIKTVDDLRTQEVALGATGPSSGSSIDARVLADLLGFKFKIVMGYPGLNEVRLAAQQGELNGHCGLLISDLKVAVLDNYKAGRAIVPIQMGVEKHPEMTHVPNAFDMIKSEEDRQVMLLAFGPWTYGRPLVGPGGLPPERLELLREAFQKTMADADFGSEAKKLNLEIQPLTPDKIEPLVAELFKTPPHVIERVRRILGIIVDER
jgi:tripartite-type tricarboxylate transporter receptor subunit TctC